MSQGLQFFSVLIGVLIAFLTAVRMITKAYERTKENTNHEVLPECVQRFEACRNQTNTVDAKVEGMGKEVYSLKQKVMANDLELSEIRTDNKYIRESLARLEQMITRLNRDLVAVLIKTGAMERRDHESD